MAEYDVTIHDSIEQIDENQWNNLVTQSDVGSIFHRSEWLRLVEDTLDRTARHLVVAKDENPVALLPNFRTDIYVPGYEDVARRLPLAELVSAQPGYGGPIVGSNEATYLDLLLETVPDVDGWNLFHTIRTNDLEFTRYGKTMAKHDYSPVAVNCRFRIDLLQDWETIRDRMHKERRRVLRKLEDRDTEVVHQSLDDEFDTTYEMYENNLDRVDGMIYPRAFFERLATDLDDRITVCVAFVDDEEVGRYIYLHDDEQDTLHHYFAAVGDDSNFEHHPSELLHAHAIQWAKDAGYRYYDFGGTGAHFSDGGFRHKERYGGELVPTLQWQRGLSTLWPAFTFARRQYQKRFY